MIDTIVAWFVWLDDQARLRRRRAERKQRWAEVDRKLAQLAGMH